MKYQMANDIFAASGGREFLAAYGIEAGDDLIKAFSRGRYLSKTGKTAALAGMLPAILLANGESIILHAGIAPVDNLPSNCTLKSAIRLYAPKSTYPTRTFSDIAISQIGTKRPFLAYIVGKSWNKAVANVTVTLDPSEVIFCGDVSVNFDKKRIDRIMDFVEENQIQNIASLRNYLDRVHFQVEEKSSEKLVAALSKLLRFTKQNDREDRKIRMQRFTDGAGSLPPYIDEPSWSAAARKFELAKLAKKGSQP